MIISNCNTVLRIYIPCYYQDTFQIQRSVSAEKVRLAIQGNGYEQASSCGKNNLEEKWILRTPAISQIATAECAHTVFYQVSVDHPHNSSTLHHSKPWTTCRLDCNHLARRPESLRSISLNLAVERKNIYVTRYKYIIHLWNKPTYVATWPSVDLS